MNERFSLKEWRKRTKSRGRKGLILNKKNWKKCADMGHVYCLFFYSTARKCSSLSRICSLNIFHGLWSDLCTDLCDCVGLCVWQSWATDSFLWVRYPIVREIEDLIWPAGTTITTNRFLGSDSWAPNVQEFGLRNEWRAGREERRKVKDEERKVSIVYRIPEFLCCRMIWGHPPPPQQASE